MERLNTILIISLAVAIFVMNLRIGYLNKKVKSMETEGINE